MATIISVTLLLAGLGGMVGTVVWILRRGNNNAMTREFVGCQLSVAMWLISQLLILFSVTEKQLFISYFIGNAGICAFAPLWLMFSAEYSESVRESRIFNRVLPAVAAAMLIFISLNPFHKLYYTDFGKGNIRYGAAFYVFQLLFYVMIAWGISLILIRQTKRDGSAANQSALLALAAAVPLVINIFYITGILKSKMEPTPLFFAFSVVMVQIAIRRYGLLNINRIAIYDMVRNISEAMIVFDAEGKMTYTNKSAELLLPVEDKPELPVFLGRLSELGGAELSVETASAELTLDGEKYSLRSSQCLNDKGTAIARTILINNISEYYELAEAEKKLSIEQERNRIAQEIHDSAGHTFTMISSIAKILHAGAANGETEKSQLLEYTREIDGLARSGVTQLRCSINNLRDDSFLATVSGAVRTVTEAVRNIAIDLCIQGEEDGSFGFCVRQVYDSTRETVTNAVRYSSAERIDIILKFLSDRLELYIFDNGCGCGEIKENDGLKGIRSRIEELGGTVRFGSVEGEGFSTIIKIPKR